MRYAEKLKDPRWQKVRLKILEQDNWTCLLCTEKTKTLHVHHEEYGKCDPWEVPTEKLGTLCEDCHDIAHKVKGVDGVTYQIIEDHEGEHRIAGFKVQCKRHGSEGWKPIYKCPTGHEDQCVTGSGGGICGGFFGGFGEDDYIFCRAPLIFI